jgi:hypothetical protein
MTIFWITVKIDFGCNFTARRQEIDPGQFHKNSIVFMSNPGSYLDRLQNDACYMESLDVHQVNGDLLKPLTKQKVCIKQANRIHTLCKHKVLGEA